ncbi:MAG: putative molybdenum carrier protein [Desulfobacterales bacterium]|nr:putative molybdenum carrier protein [Desulfobacterales bacterium]
MIEKIISGGQTGADRAALDAAIEIDIPHGGWVPKGRLAEDGAVPLLYHLSEMPTDSYAVRTEQNVVDSDGTLILSHGPLSGGSALTQDLAEKHERFCLHIDLNRIPTFKAAAMIAAWIALHHIKTLNVAGPRASSDPDIYQKIKSILIAAFHKERRKNNGV